MVQLDSLNILSTSKYRNPHRGFRISLLSFSLFRAVALSLPPLLFVPFHFLLTLSYILRRDNSASRAAVAVLWHQVSARSSWTRDGTWLLLLLLLLVERASR